jgi:hypothetical protein
MASPFVTTIASSRGGRHNNGMHPTAVSAAFIGNLAVAGLCARRVMPGVRCLSETKGGCYEFSK